MTAGRRKETMRALQILLVDDEELARLRMRGLLADCAEPAVRVVAEAPNALAARVWLAEHQCDVVLLDIAMPGMNGMDLAAELRRRDDAPVVVFVTAHPEHAVSAFDVDAVDYLTKPVRRDRLQAALARAAQRLQTRRHAGPATEEATEMAAEPAPEPVIVVSDRGRIVRVPVSQALYFKAELKYVTLRTAERSHVLDDSLSDLEQRVGPRFIRVHRNALVARHAVRALERRVIAGEGEEEGGATWAVRVAPLDEWLAVSRRQVAAVREALAADGV